jgi:hypothetical protein
MLRGYRAHQVCCIQDEVDELKKEISKLKDKKPQAAKRATSPDRRRV